MRIGDLNVRKSHVSTDGSSSPAAAFELLEPRLLLSGSIDGAVWHDVNADGIRDAGEVGLNGWTVELVNVATGQVEATQVSAGVDVNGDGTIDPQTEAGLYAFVGLSADDYVVHELAQPGWTQSYPAPSNWGWAGPEMLLAEGGGQFSIARAPNGDIVALQSTGYTVYLYLFDADGTPKGDRIIVDTHPSNQYRWKSEPTIAMSATGRFTAVWNRRKSSPDVYDVYACTYEADGTPVGNAVLVGETGSTSDGALAAAPLAGGQVLVGWMQRVEYHDEARWRILDADGTLIGGVLEIPGAIGRLPSAASASDGRYVVVTIMDDAASRIVARLFAADGSPVGDPVIVNESPMSEWPAHPSVAMDDVGRFVVAWGVSKIKARRFNPDGTPGSGVFEVSPESTWNKSVPRMAMDASGRLAIAWQTYNQDGDTYGVFAQFYGADGAPDGQEIQVNPGGYHAQTNATLAFDAAGNLAIGWNRRPHDGGLSDARFRLFGADAAHSMTLGDGEVVQDADFGNYGLSSIGGQKFNDANINAQRDGGEVGIDGVRVNLLYLKNSGTDIVVGTQVTAGVDLNGDGTIDPVTEAGLYRFEGLRAGTYELREVPADEWFQTCPDPARPAVTLGAGQDVSGVDFGNAYYSSIAGQKFSDDNADALRNAGEIGMDGWTIELVDAGSGTVLATQVTAGVDLNADGAIDPISEAGLYLFEDLAGGNYVVREVGRTGWRQTVPTGDGTHAVALGYAEDLTGVDFGNEPLMCEVIGRKFADDNGNGVWDIGEAGLNGWTIDLVVPDTGAVVDTQVTRDVDLDGNGVIDPRTETGVYRFGDVLTGRYIVREVPQAGWAHAPYTAGGGLGSEEVLVNSHIGEVQYWPLVASNSSGRRVVVWHTYDRQASQYGTRAQLYNADGTPDGEEILVTTGSDGSHLNKRTINMAMNDSGRFIVVWEGGSESNPVPGIHARLFAADGTPEGDAFQVNSLATHEQEKPDVAINDDGEFVIVWLSGSDDIYEGVLARKYAADGTAVGSEIVVHDRFFGYADHPAVDMTSDGDFAVVWDASSYTDGMYGRFYNADMTPSSDEFRVNGDYRASRYADVAVNDSGLAVITWADHYSRPDGKGGVKARLYDFSGVPIDEELHVTPGPNYGGTYPTVALDDTGRFVIAWDGWLGGDDDYDVLARAFGPNGVPDGEVFRVNRYVTDEQTRCGVAIDGEGRFVFAWEGINPGGEREDIYTRRFTGFSDDNYIVVDLVEGQILGGVDLGSFTVASVGGQVFEDVNFNGVKDAGETGLDGWQIDLLDPASGTLLGSVLTASVDVDGDGAIDPDTETGRYLYGDLMPGSYTVRRWSQDGWMDTAPTGESVVVALRSNEHPRATHFGQALTGSVAGQVFEDVNGDGIRGGDEVGMDGWTVRLIDPADGGELASTVTASADLNGDGRVDPITETGLYTFGDLSAGPYELAQVDQAGWVRTLPAGQAHTVALEYNQDQAAWDFGNQAVPSEIHGQKFHDIDGDGVRDAGEVGMSGWAVELVDLATGAVLATQVTADVDVDGDGTIDPATEAGLYSFVGVAHGRYEVREVLQAGWLQTYPANRGPGTITRAVMVNTQTPGDQTLPQVAADAVGNYVVVWQSDEQDGQEYGIYAQRYRADGTPDGGEFRANSRTNDTQEHPAVAMNAGGQFVIVWESDDQDTDGYGIYGQKYHADGTRDGWEFRANSEVIGDQVRSAVGIDDTGRFVVVWDSDGPAEPSGGVFARIFNADGTPEGDEFQVNTYVTDRQEFASVAMTSTGVFGIAWQSYRQDDDSSYSVYARIYNADGTPRTGEVRADAYTTGYRRASSIAIDASGRFVVVWRGAWEGGSASLRRRLFDANGVPVDDEFRIATVASNNAYPSIAMGPSGRHIVTWADEGSAVRARMFDPDGWANGGEFAVATGDAYAVVAMANSGRAVIVWRNWADPADGDDGSVHATRLTGFSDDWGHQVTATPGGVVTGADFGNSRPVTVSGQMFEDRNANTHHDAGEAGMDGWTIELVHTSSSLVRAKQVTASIDLNGDGVIDAQTESGRYEFTGLMPDRYIVRQVARDGWDRTRPAGGKYAFTAETGGAYARRDFGNYKTSTIAGRSFEDIDGNSLRGPGESGMDGWLIRLVDPASGQVVRTAVTAGVDLDGDGLIDPASETGLYTFKGLMDGPYEIHQVPRSGWRRTVPAGPHVVSLAYDSHLVDRDFGNQAVRGEIRGQKFNDINADGVRNGDEEGLDGWTIELVDPFTHVVLATVVTESIDLNIDGLIEPETESGLYSFVGLDYERDYEVREVAPEGWVQTAPADPSIALAGPEFQVNTFTEGHQAFCNVAMHSSGRAVIVWQSSGQDGDLSGVFAQRYDETGTPVGDEFQVNTFTAHNQSSPVVEMDAEGNFVIAWDSTGPNYGGNARLYSADGTPLGVEFIVGSKEIAIAVRDTGEFIVTWVQDDASYTGVYARRFQADGTPMGDVFQVNSNTSRRQREPAVAVSNSGRFVITWQSESGETSSSASYGIYAQLYNADGTRDGLEFHVNTKEYSWQTTPSVAMDDTGRFMILWFSGSNRPGEGGSWGQVFAADGSRIGGDFSLGDSAIPSSEARVSATDTNEFIVTWQQGSTAPDYGDIYLQAFGPGGVAIDQPFRVNTYTAGTHEIPGIGVDGAGNALVAWHDYIQDGSYRGVFAARVAVLRHVPVRIVRLTPGQVSGGNDFGSYLGGAIAGQIFDDPDANGTRDAGEASMDGWTIELVDPTSGQVLDSVVTASADLNGDGTIDLQSEAGLYEFTDLASGPRVVRQLWQRGWAPVSPITGAQSVTVIADAVQPADFANHALAGDVHGQKFSDLNANGLADAGEAGLDGWTIELVDPVTGAVLDTTVTAGYDLNGDGAIDADYESGLYAFSGLADGAGYVVREVARAGWLQTAPHSVEVNPSGEFQVNTYVTDDQQAASIAMNASGEYIIAWTSEGQDGDVTGIHAQRYHADGTPNGGEFQVNTYTTDRQWHPVAAMNDAGQFVIAWESNEQDWNGYGIFAQLYGSDGVAVGDEFLVNTYRPSGQTEPTATMDVDGRFAIAWRGPIPNDTGVGFFAQRYLADGTPDGDEYRLLTYDGNERLDPLAAVDAEGNFVRVRVAYDSHSDGIYAQRYFADGTLNGEEFLVNTVEQSRQRDPAVAMAGNGRFVVTWHSFHIADGDDRGDVYAQMYHPNGMPDGGEFLVNITTDNYQTFPAVAMNDSGDFVVAWDSWGTDDASYGISARRFRARQVHHVTARADQAVGGLHFGNYRIGKIAGRAFEDLNGQGGREPGELGLDGWTIELVDDATGSVLATAVTAGRDLNGDGSVDPATEAGLYEFRDLPLGVYSVRTVVQAGWLQSAPASGSTVVDLAGPDVTDADFGSLRLGSIAGVVFEDADGNAARDAGEAGLDGWVVELVDPAGGLVLQTQWTSGGGAYAFADLLPSEYQVRQVDHAGWTLTVPAGQAHTQTLVSGLDVTGRDFGNKAVGSQIHGAKWNDVNTDGVRDAGETGLDGWTIELVDSATGQVIDTQVTASVDVNGDGAIDPATESGLYAFTDLPRGLYEVREVPRAGWELTYPAASGGLTFVQALTDGQDGVDGIDFPYSATVSDDGTCVYVAGYVDDAVAVFTRDAASGELTFVGAWKDGADGVDGLDGAFAVAVSSDRRHVYVAGSRDSALAVFTQDPATNALTFVQIVKTGIGGVSGLRGVRDVTVSPDGAHVYAAGNSDDAVAVFSRDAATGELTFVEAVKNGVDGIDGLDGVYSVVVSPDGRNVYAAGYISDALVAFTRDAATGKLSMLGVLKDGVDGVDGLNGARMASVSPDGRHVYVAGYSDNALAVFSRDAATGELAFVQALRDGDPGVDGLARAVSVAVSPDGHHVYAVGYSDRSVTVLSRDATSGELTVVQLASDAGAGPYSAVVSPDGRHVYATAIGGDVLTVFQRDQSPVHYATLDAGQVVTGRDFGNYLILSDAPGDVDLLGASDTGANDGDDLTNLDNSSAATTLQFAVSNTLAGATVTIYADGIAIGSAVAAAAGTTVVTTGGTHDLADGEHTVTARQTEAGMPESSDSAGLVITVDTAAPSVEALGLSSTSGGWTLGTIGSALWTTDRGSRTAPWSMVDQLVVSFDEPVVLAAVDVTLTGVAGAATNPPAAAGSGSAQATCTLAAPLVTDRYTVVLAAGVTDAAGNALGAEWSTGLNVLVGDINGDGRVSSRDRRALRDAYASATGDANYTVFADLNGDGRVSSRDRRTLRDNYATDLPAPAPSAAPMPSIGDTENGGRSPISLDTQISDSDGSGDGRNRGASPIFLFSPTGARSVGGPDRSVEN